MLNNFFLVTRDAWLPLVLAILGFALVALVDNEVVAAEVAIFVTFGLNIAVLLRPSLRPFKRLARRMSAAFALGAVGALLVMG